MSGNASRGMLVLFPFLVGFACPATAAPEARVSETYGKLPLHFEANRGQTHEDVRFLARGAGYSLYLTAGEGVLVLHAAGGAIRQRVPVIYQEIDGVRTKIEGRYVLKDAHRVGFQVAAYDQSRPLVIDPTLVYFTYLGGSVGDGGYAIAVDAAGAAYVTGPPRPADFTAGCTAACTVLDGTLGGFRDAFVTKINATGTALVYSTYLGGSGDDVGLGIAVDAAGAAYVTGDRLKTAITVSAAATSTIAERAFHVARADFVADGSAASSAERRAAYLGGTR